MRLDLTKTKCAIFDMDGTILDSMPMWHSVADTYIEQCGLVPEKDLWDKVKRLTESETAEYFIERYGIKKSVSDICADIESLIFQEYEENLSLKPGVLDFFDFLESRGIKIALATATDRKCVLACLGRLGIMGRFSAILTCMELSTSKFKPLIFEESARACGAEKSESAVFEDALHCVRTAKAAGFLTVAMYDESDEEKTEPPKSDWERIAETADAHFMDFASALRAARESDAR